MQAVSIAARQGRRHYRHELRTLTYVTLDQANGGIVRNLNGEGVAVQAVAALRQHQRVRLRFELRFPHLRVETYGQVTWASASGQCGIRFVDLPDRTAHQINQWIFANLLENADLEASHSPSIFGDPIDSMVCEENANGKNLNGRNAALLSDGLTLSASSRPAIRLNTASSAKRSQPLPTRQIVLANSDDEPARQNLLTRPISGRTLAWLVDGLVITAAILLFALIFLSIAHELPRWPLTLTATTLAALLIVATYRIMFAVLGGQSAGARLAQAYSLPEDKEEREAEDRFR